MKKNSILFFLAIFSISVSAQDSTVVSLQQLNASAKSQYVPVETLDQVQHRLKYFDEHPVSKADQPLLLDTYNALAMGYSANNHFKQGYGVYQKLLSLKESFLSAEKAEAIANANSHVEEIQRKDEDELLRNQNEIRQLQTDSDYLQAKRKSFKKYFSFIIVSLTAVFAFMLLQGGIKLNKIKQELREGRDRLKTIHRVSMLGQLRKGILQSINTMFSSIKKLSEENSTQLDRMSQGEKNSEISTLRKLLNELKGLS